MCALRILLVDDHTLFRRGLASLLTTQPDFAVVGEAADGLEAIAQLSAVRPHVVLLDIRMPRCGGLEALGLIRQQAPQTQVIMLTASDDDRDLFAAIRGGAAGYLLKDIEPEALFAMLRAVRRGEVALTGALAAKVVRGFMLHDAQLTEPTATELLSAREIEVLAALASGATNSEIAAALIISTNTVKLHVANILRKLRLDNRIQAAVYAAQHGLVDGRRPGC